MVTSISSQLQAIKSLIQVDTEPRSAADIDTDTVFYIALSGLDVLLSTKKRFRNYKSDLFSHMSKELDRELVAGTRGK